MKKILTIVLLIFLISTGSEVVAQDSLWQRKYEFGMFNNYDLRNSSQNMISTHRLLNDGFDDLLASRMNPKTANITKGIFGFATTYLGMLWSHEFGHYIRAKQVGGTFNIHNFGLPIPYTTADLPTDISLPDEAIFVTAGFEVNYLNIRNIQSQFIRQNGIANTDLAFSFANRLMHPIYTTLIVPINAEDKEVWIETAGDPVHYILPVFKNYSDGQVFMQDSTVNPDLVRFYDQASLLAQLFPLLDPQFYREVMAAFGSSKKTRRPVFLFGDHSNGWTYGTLFNASPLGYELYLQNYIHLKDKQYGVYLKYGRPFKNIGLGLTMNNIVHTTNFQTDLIVDLWQQDIFGNGVSAEIVNRWRISDKFGLNVNLGYKTEGYVLGKQLKSGFNLGLGFCYYRN